MKEVVIIGECPRHKTTIRRETRVPKWWISNSPIKVWCNGIGEGGHLVGVSFREAQ